MTLSELAKTPPDPEAQRKERLAALWKKAREHPTFQRLHADPNFKAAHKLFRAKQRGKSSGRYAEEYAELRFHNIVATIVTIHESHPNVKPRLPSLATAEKAHGCIAELLKCMDEGVRLSKWPDDDNLRAGLAALKEKLETERLSDRKRKPRSDEFSSQRYYIDGLIGMLHSAFGEASPKIVANIAAMMGYSIDPSTVDRRKSEVLSAKARRSPADRQSPSRA